MDDAPAIREGRFRRVVTSILRYEPKVLDGLTWRHFGYVALLAIAFGVGRAAQALHDPPLRVAWYWVPMFSMCGLSVLLCAVLLTNLKLHRIPRSIVLALAVIVGCAVAFQLHNSLWLSQPLTFGEAIHKLRVVWLQWGLVMAAYYFIERSARRASELREAELERHRLEAEMLEARLRVMQAQVEPHFLFNTLAHIQRLYETNPIRGRSMLDSFCAYLRAALPRMRGNHSTLGREASLARAYLDMQRIRMGRRLRYEIAVPDNLAAATFPPMMLLSLVENAIKHGLSPLRAGGSIRIVADLNDGRLRVTVADTGIGLSTSGNAGGDGVGLSNIRSRLAALYRGRGRLSLHGNSPHGVVAAIDVPLTVKEHAAMPCAETRLQASQSSDPVATATV
jgi:hypothetical protein